MSKIRKTIRKKKVLKLPMCFPTMTKPDRVTVREWYVKEGDIIEPPTDIEHLPPLLDVDAPYAGGSEIEIPVPEFLRRRYRVVKILKPAQSTVQLSDRIITLQLVKNDVA